MDYELLTQLQEAGFPLKLYPEWAAVKDGPMAPKYISPNLEELIAACGDRFDSLERMADTNPVGKWAAWTRALQPMPKRFWGSTPDEAVARLWLALHANGDATA